MRNFSIICKLDEGKFIRFKLDKPLTISSGEVTMMLSGGEEGEALLTIESVKISK